MESKKDIGKLFRENLEQLDFTPSAKVWEQIELDLTEKKKKRRFFIWFFFTAIITSGIIGGIAYNLSNEKVVTTTESAENSVVNADKTQSSTTEKQLSNDAAFNETQGTNRSKAIENDAKKAKNNLINNVNKAKATTTKNLQKNNKYKPFQQLASSTISLKKKQRNKKRNAMFVTNGTAKEAKNPSSIDGSNPKETSKETFSTAETQTNPSQTNVVPIVEKQTAIDSLIATKNKKQVEKKKTH